MNRKEIVFILTAVLLVCGTQGISEAVDKMYWTDGGRGNIQRSNLDGTQIEDLVTGSIWPLHIALNMSSGKMYWTNSHTDKIQRANLDGTNIEDLVTRADGLRVPGGIALDVSNGKMYWADRDGWGDRAGYTSKIQRANLDGTNIEDLVTTGLREPYGIALDVSGGKMYWVDYTVHKIQRANLDGTQVETLVTGLSSPPGIALDVVGRKMYWTNRYGGKIQRANLDGTQVEDLVTGLSGLQGIALDVSGGKMYWADAETDKIQRANLDGTQIEDLVTGLGGPQGIALGIPTPSGDDHGNTPATATPLSLDSPQTGTINPARDKDYFRLEVTTAGELTVETTGSLDTIGFLENSAGITLASDNNDGAGNNFRIVHDVTPGTYYIDVESALGDTGSYTIRASMDVGGDPPQTPPPGQITIFSEDWESGTIDATKWVEYGSPRPRIVPFFEGYTNVFDNNGDPNHGSGALTTNPINFPSGEMTISADIYVDFSDLSGCWATARIGLTNEADPTTSNTGFSGGYAVYFELSAVGDACWAAPAERRRKAWFGGGMRNTAGDWEGTGSAPIDGSNYVNGWHKLRIVISESNRVSFYVDDTLLWQSSGMLDPIFRSGRRLDLGERSSGSAGKAYIDNIAVGAVTGTGPGPGALDVNGDGQVNVLDLMSVAISYGRRGDGLPADVDGNGVVDADDFEAVANGVDAANPLHHGMEEALLAALEQAIAVEDVAGAPMASNTPQHVLSGDIIYHNVAAALVDVRHLAETSNARLSKAVALLETLLQLLTEMRALPETTALLPNYPNPFNPETWIPYHLARPAAVTVTIYDIYGRVVRDLDLGHQRAGMYQSRNRAAHWDGRNAQGESVASGVYFYTLTAGDFTATRKLLIAK